MHKSSLMHKKPEFWKKFLLMKNLQFLPELDETLSNWPTHFWYQLVKFHQNLVAYFHKIPVFYAEVPKFIWQGIQFHTLQDHAPKSFQFDIRAVQVRRGSNPATFNVGVLQLGKKKEK